MCVENTHMVKLGLYINSGCFVWLCGCCMIFEGVVMGE